MQITINLPPETIQEIIAGVYELQLANSPITNVPTYSENKIYRVNDVAEIMKSNRRTIINHINKGILKATKQGLKYLITEQSLNNYKQNKI